MGDEPEKPEMTFWGPTGGKMPEVHEMVGKSTPFWLTGLFKDPTAVFRHELLEGSLSTAIARVAGIGLILGLLNALLFSLAGFNPLTFFFMLVVYPLSMTIAFLIWNAIIFAFARLFGGSGEFGKQASLFSLLVLFSFAVEIILLILSVFPFVMFMVFPPLAGCSGPLFILVFVFLFFFMIYLQVHAIAAAHKIDILRSFGALLLSVLLVAAVSVAIAVLFISPMLESLVVR